MKLFIDTLADAEIEKIEARLRPGRSSHSGFLGERESLRQVIHDDAKTLDELGVSYGQIISALHPLLNSKGNEQFRVGRTQYRGFQEDPFVEKFNIPPYSSCDYVVTKPNGDSISFPGLIVQLITNYQFFEGKESPYRLDPRRVVEFFELKGDMK